ncbi:MAG: NADH-quinone oxidoreductase subunit J [Nitrospirota bacterium]|nr:NADH-quinone oxidoreductase subunit J [Nitrospirota bacterium]
METFVFFYFATIIVVTAGLVVALKNPVYSALALLVMFFHVAGLFVTLHAEFLAIIQILVYAGAILVLYLFVVMLLNLKREVHFHNQFVVGLFLGCVLFAEAVLLVMKGETTLGSPLAAADTTMELTQGNTESIGMLLYSTYLFPFEVASLILLVAMVGAVILTKKGILEVKS